MSGSPADLIGQRRTPPPAPTLPARPGFHPCPVPGCRRDVSDGHVACRAHWTRLPARQRAELAGIFRRRTADPEAFAGAWERARNLVLAWAERNP